MSSALPRNYSLEEIAEHRATQITAGWDRLDAGRVRVESQRAGALAETEALALARIRADTERQLANQATALRDAEHAAELVAIERRNKDLEAAREAERRRCLDGETAAVARARRIADTEATVAAEARRLAEEAARAARRERIEAERAAYSAHRGMLRVRLALAWAILRNLQPIAVLGVALALGTAAGYGWARWERAGFDAVMAGDAGLRLETELRSVGNDLP